MIQNLPRVAHLSDCGVNVGAVDASKHGFYSGFQFKFIVAAGSTLLCCSFHLTWGEERERLFARAVAVVIGDDSTHETIRVINPALLAATGDYDANNFALLNHWMSTSR